MRIAPHKLPGNAPSGTFRNAQNVGLAPMRGALVPPLFAAFALALSACSGDEHPPAKVPVPLAVASPGAGQEGRTITVNASDPRTPIGHFHAGERVSISILEGAWVNAPGPDTFGARGKPGTPCISDFQHTCLGQSAPFMGLLLITVTDAAAQALAETQNCHVQTRLPIPSGVEFLMPFDADVELGPNDREDSLSNNTGAILVQVGRARAKGQVPFEKKDLLVDAAVARTFAGRFSRDEYLTVTVKGGNWKGDFSQKVFDSAGSPTDTCANNRFTCLGPTGAPLMSLVMLLSVCDQTAVSRRESRVEKAFIPDGAKVTLARDAHLYLAPNDWEDDYANNSGSVKVLVRTHDK